MGETSKQDFEVIHSTDVFFSLFFLAEPHGLWDLSSLIRDQTRAPCTLAVEAWSLNHWTAREVPN